MVGVCFFVYQGDKMEEAEHNAWCDMMLDRIADVRKEHERGIGKIFKVYTIETAEMER